MVFGILSSIAIPQFKPATNKAKQKEAQEKKRKAQALAKEKAAAAAKKKGMSEKMLKELIAVVGMANETNKLVEAYQVEVDNFLK